VVLTNATLPWQRSPKADPPAVTGFAQAPTWLAVLLFDQDDPPPAPRQGTLAELTSPPAGTGLPPFTLEQGETAADPVTYVDVPFGLFNAIAPTTADLGWLAHAREVDPSQKASGGSPAQTPGAAGTEQYAVVFGNRLPAAGNTSTAMLVSLEGFDGYLPADDGTPGASWSTAPQAVRLVCLQSWTFGAVELPETFQELLTGVSRSALQMPFDASAPSASADADAAVQAAFGMGYTALDHALVDGGTTVSWYRGPLLPLGASSAVLTPPYAGPDPLLRYDPQTGLFDVSYAAAWQLGQLLALQNSSYARALYRWKLTQTHAAVAAEELALLDRQLPPAAALSLAAGNGRFAAVARSLVAPAVAQLNPSPDPA
jgi:hypothetical protein